MWYSTEDYCIAVLDDGKALHHRLSL